MENMLALNVCWLSNKTYLRVIFRLCFKIWQLLYPEFVCNSHAYKKFALLLSLQNHSFKFFFGVTRKKFTDRYL